LNGSARGAEWDPSVVAEFTDFGKVLYQREAVLDAVQNVEIVHRFKPQKIDRIRHQGSVTRPMGATLWWMVVIVCNNVNPVATGVNFVNSWNLSFAGDVIS